MAQGTTAKLSIAYFQAARERYIARRFAEACALMQRYRQTIDYAQFERIDQRPKIQPEISVVIVSYQTNQALLGCLKSVFAQQCPPFEVILVDNGGNQSIHDELATQSLLWLRPPINLLPSEGRNIGAHFARSDLLVFLDDDALMAPGYLAAAHLIMEGKTFLGLRGRIQPKTPNAAVPGHYDLGERPMPAEFNLEGNMVIRSQAFKEVGGFDPLMFGHEGKELAIRCKHQFPDIVIEYRPELSVQHDFAEFDRFEAKRERQSLGQNYLNYLQRGNMSVGVSILIRAGDNLVAAKDFLESLIKHNSYTSIEILLWAKDSQHALAISRGYLTKFLVRVLPASTNILARITRQARYNNLLIVDVPTQITSDVLPDWLQQQQTNRSTALLCSKQEVHTLTNVSLTIALCELTKKLGKHRSHTSTKLDSRANTSASKPALQSLQAERTEYVPILSSNNYQDNVKKIKVSIVIPVYNKVGGIKRAFDSTLALYRDDVEIIFIDDCSVDGSIGLIEEIINNCKNAKAVFNSTNIGAGASRNIGINKATGEYIFFLDADDQLDGEALSQLIETADTSKADLVRGRIKGVKSDGTYQVLAKEHLLHDTMKTGVTWQNEKSLWFYWYFTANLYRRRFLDSNFIRFPEGVRNEDPLFLCKCYLYAKNIVLHPSISYLYSITEAQHNRSGEEFLKGWVLGYYSIYQLICGSNIQKSLFLCQFPSLEKHCNDIAGAFNEEDAVRLLKYISVMFKSFYDDLKPIESHLRLQKITSWQQKELDATINFAKKISGRSALGIYSMLK